MGMLAIEVLKKKRAELREKARFYNRRHHNDGTVSVRTWNLLRQCARITASILILKHIGGVA
jgi:hypothetical protein